jgi:thioredoxin reductase (NADPH)
MPDLHDVLVIGAGPTGLACAIEARRAGLSAVNVEKGCLVDSLWRYPTNLVFFTTAELLEIGDVPFASVNAKPTRAEALEYYRRVAAHYALDVRQYERVEAVGGRDEDFRVQTTDRLGRRLEHRARKVVVAIGYYDRPNLMGLPGEDLPKVSHYYRDPHPCHEADVLVIGGKNSAAIAALDLWRHGARVTLVHRGPGLHQHVKYWIRPDLENRIAAGQVRAYFDTTVTAIAPDSVRLAAPGGEVRLPNDFVFALTGYHPDFGFLERLGVALSGPDRRPVCDPETLESNVPGIHLAGVIVAGMRTNEIFIENGRFHGRQIAAALRGA